MRKQTGLAVLAIVLLSAVYGQATEKIVYRATVIDVVDGDTIVISNKVGPHGITLRSEEPVDLDGIDAPELGQPGGEEAKEFLTEIVKGREVSIVELTDMGKSRGAWILVGGVEEDERKNVNLLMVQKGLVWNVKSQVHMAGESKKMEKLQAAAKAQKLGIWASENPIKPVEWVEQHGSQGKSGQQDDP